jgi:hypothetical protein
MPALPVSAAPPLSAGVGETGRAAHPEYSVKLVFAQLKGPYMAQVQVQVTDAQGGTVVDMVSEGPWLFLDLAPGDYRVRATSKAGVARSAAFTVSGDGQETVYVTWLNGD